MTRENKKRFWIAAAALALAVTAAAGLMLHDGTADEPRIASTVFSEQYIDEKQEQRKCEYALAMIQDKFGLNVSGYEYVSRSSLWNAERETLTDDEQVMLHMLTDQFAEAQTGDTLPSGVFYSGQQAFLLYKDADTYCLRICSTDVQQDNAGTADGFFRDYVIAETLSGELSVQTEEDRGSIGQNEAGETYGPKPVAYDLGIELDLIAAVGNRQIEGYIRTEDQEPPEFETLEERATYNGVDRVIPLYAVDGVTILDTFTIGGR